MSESYKADDRYALLVTKLAALHDADNQPADPENEIKIILGEFGDIWPASIRPVGEGVVLRLVR